MHCPLMVVDTSKYASVSLTSGFLVSCASMSCRTYILGSRTPTVQDSCSLTKSLFGLGPRTDMFSDHLPGSESLQRVLLMPRGSWSHGNWTEKAFRLGSRETASKDVRVFHLPRIRPYPNRP